MSLPRCKQCKSEVNPQRYARCIGCGAAVDDVLPPSKRVRPRVLLEGTKDAGRSKGILSVIGILGIVTFFGGLSEGSGYAMILGGAAAVAGTMTWMYRTARGLKGETAGRGCLRLVLVLFLCGVALFFGLGILLGFACIENRGGGFH